MQADLTPILASRLSPAELISEGFLFVAEQGVTPGGVYPFDEDNRLYGKTGQVDLRTIYTQSCNCPLYGSDVRLVLIVMGGTEEWQGA